MSMSKLLITLGLVLLMTLPLTVAQAEEMAYSGSGTAVISDAGAMSNKVTVSMSGVTMLEQGSAYEGWLIDSDSGDMVSIGVLNPIRGAINHSWISPDNANLLAMYDSVAITVESMPDDDPAPSEVMAFHDMVNGDAMAHIRNLVGSGESTLTQLQMQIHMAMAKVDAAQSADDLDALKASTEEAVAIIDADDGIVALAMSATADAASAAEMAPGAMNVSMYGSMVQSSSMNVSSWASAAKDDAASVTAEDDLETAKTLLNIVNGKLLAAANGIPASRMGGASDAYMQAQQMATFQLPPPAPAEVGTPAAGDGYVPAAMQAMLFVALMLLIGGGAMLYRERRLSAKA